MKFKYLLAVLTLALWLAGGQTASATEIAPGGEKLIAVLDSMHVDKLWLAGQQVNWRTGQPTGKTYTNASSHTHCSAFAAAAAEKLGVYLLHPPEHSAVLLANAQQDWLRSKGTNYEWCSVASPLQAQQLANQGELVLVTCKNHNPNFPGHIAIVRPSTKSEAAILSEGPQVTQAGAQNHISTNAKEGFKNHRGAFENNELLYFAHPLPAASVKPEQTAALPTGSAPQ